MTLIKVAKRVTPQYTFFAYKKVNGQKESYVWRNPYNDALISITKTALKKWETIQQATV